MQIHILGFLLLCLSSTAIADLYTDAVDRRDFEMLMHTFSEAKVDHPALIGKIGDASVGQFVGQREHWRKASDSVITLPSSMRVVQGLEMAVLFLFDSASDRRRFHDVVTRYAKKDSEDEPGLIADSWWQPFYYTDSPMAGFQPISLIVVASDTHEATLTVLEEKSQDVIEALADNPWPTRVERVWVNPPFYRFLGGVYK